MAEAYKILGQTLTGDLALDALTVKESIVYEVPSNKQSAVSAIRITNSSPSSQTYKLSFVPYSDVQSAQKQISYTLYENQQDLFITMGDNQVFYSQDGLKFKSTTLPFYFNTRPSIVYGNGKWVAVGVDYSNNSKIIYSTNGITWTEVQITTSSFFTSVTYGNGKFVITTGNESLGTANKVFYSTNGTSWTETTLPTQGNWSVSAYGNNKFVILSRYWSNQSATANFTNKALYSSDGITWTETTLPVSRSWYSLTYGGKFVAFQGSTPTGTTQQLIYSLDGVTWSTSTPPIILQGVVTYGNGKYVAISTFTGQTIFSYDGIIWTIANWTQLSTLGSDAGEWNSLVFGNNQYLAISDTGNVGYSTDGIYWAKLWNITDAGNAGGMVRKSAAFGPGYLQGTKSNAFVIFDYTSLYYSLNEGSTWTKGSTLYSVSSPWSSAIYANNRFIALAPYTNKTAISSDGITWTLATQDFLYNWTDIAYGYLNNSEMFIATANVTDQGFAWNRVAYSTNNGVTWNASNTIEASNFASVVYTGNRFVLGSYSNKSAYSSDGISWTVTTLPDANVKYAKLIAGTNNKIVALGYFAGNGVATNKSAYSLNGGTTWTESIMPYADIWSDGIYGNETFIAVSNSSDKMAYSSDGITWTGSTLPADYLTKLGYNGGKFIALRVWFSNVMAFTSTDGITWTQKFDEVLGGIASRKVIHGQIALTNVNSQTIPESANKHIAIYNKTINPNQTHEIKGGITLSAGDQIRAYSTSSNIAVNVYGVEIS